MGRGPLGVVLTSLAALALSGTSAAQASAGTASDVSDQVRAALDALTLEEVLDSARSHFPMLQVMRLEREARAGKVLSTDGAFDLKIGAKAHLQPLSFYENYSAGGGLEQPTTLWGTRLYADYRYGTGKFPSYDGGRLTDQSGEVRAGAEIPLLRGGAIDQARADRRDAALTLERLDPELQLERVQVERDAGVAFWDWLAAGRLIDIARALLDAAEARQTQIEGRVKRGGEAEINLVDNQRLVIERRVLLRGAQRDFNQAALRLSLFLRDPDGAPMVPGPDRLPKAFPEERRPDRRAFEDDLADARENHPILREFDVRRQQLELEVKVARNEMLPNVDLVLEGSQDFGDPEPGIDQRGVLSSAPRSDAEVKALIRFELPVQRRKARGRLAVAEARLAQLERRAQFQKERVVAEAAQAIEALEAAYEQTFQARENLRLAERLRTAEERKLKLGLSNLINVNIREVQAATAARQLVQAQQSYFRALADYEARIARSS